MAATADPDAVIVDASGGIGMIAGAVLVGGVSTPPVIGHVTRIAPDGAGD